MYQTASPTVLKTSGTRSAIREESSLSLTQTRNLTNAQLTQKTSGPINYATFKGKAASLEENVRNMVQDAFQFQKQELENLRAEKSEIENLLNNTINELKKNMGKQLMDIEDEMKSHVAHQKAENSRLQQQINQLKGETVGLRTQMNGMAKRVGELEMGVGNEEPQEEFK